jgi:hypothetical protein
MNMSYCIFENTLRDLEQAQDKLMNPCDQNGIMKWRQEKNFFCYVLK